MNLISQLVSRMVDKINEGEVEEKLVEEIENKLEEMNLKEKQCNGGRSQWIGERQAAMTITHLLMEEKDMDFKDANKMGWSFVFRERRKPCALSHEEPTEDGEQMDEQGEQEPTKEEHTEEETMEQVEQNNELDNATETTSNEEKQDEQPIEEK